MAITVDNTPSTRQSASAATVLSYGFTYAGGNGAIVVAHAYANNDGTQPVIDYNGQGFALPGVYVFGTVALFLAILLNPTSSGTNNVTITYGTPKAVLLATTMSFLGGIQNDWSNIANAENPAGTSLTNTLTIGDQSFMVISSASLAVDVTAGTNVTSTTAANPLAGYYGPKSGAGSLGMTVNDASVDDIASIVLELKPTTGATVAQQLPAAAQTLQDQSYGSLYVKHRQLRAPLSRRFVKRESLYVPRSGVVSALQDRGRYGYEGRA